MKVAMSALPMLIVTRSAPEMGRASVMVYCVPDPEMVTGP